MPKRPHIPPGPVDENGRTDPAYETERLRINAETDLYNAARAKPPQVDSLEAATERMNDTIRRAEALFLARFAVRGSVTRRASDGTWKDLSWVKQSGKFRLMANDTPLANASRETRVLVLPMIEDLYQELERKLPAATADDLAAVAKAEAFLTRIPAA